MRHQRHAQPVGRLHRDVHAARRRSMPEAIRPTRTFMPTIRSPVLAAAGHRLAGVAQHDLAAFADHHVAREAVDAGERDVEIGEDPAARALDDVVAEAREVAGPGAAGVDEGGGAAAPGQRVGVDAQRGAAPVDVGVQVDQPRHDEPAAGVDDVPGVVDRQVRLDRRHATVAEADVELPVESRHRDR